MNQKTHQAIEAQKHKAKKLKKSIKNNQKQLE